MGIVRGGGEVVLFLGSSNLSPKRKLNYNMESDVMVVSSEDVGVVADAVEYYDRIWGNVDGVYTSEYGEHSDESFWKMMNFRFRRVAWV